MTVLVVYSAEPNFPATDQQPGAVRYQIGGYWVDAVGTPPTLADVTAFITPPLPDLAPYQFRAMLVLSGKQAALDAYVAGLTDPAKTIAQAKLNYSLTFERRNDLVLAAQAALGLTAAQLDTLWQQAAAIK